MAEARPSDQKWSDQKWSDQKMEIIIGNLLRTGVILSAAVVLLGGIIYLARHGTEPTHYRTFHGEPSEYRTVGGIFQQVLALRGRGIIQLGLLLLIATPVARVAFAVWGFAKEHDRMYVVFTLIVLVILLYSLLGSRFAF
jgi:uncharacterized membrane protein